MIGGRRPTAMCRYSGRRLSPMMSSDKSACPLVSIVMPARNEPGSVLRAIDSVLEQTLSSWELIIIDDASANSLADQLREKLRDPRIQLIRNAIRRGAALSRNLGIEKAIGRYLAFLDSDDRWHPEKLKLQLRYMGEANCALSCTAYKAVCNRSHSNKTIRPKSEIGYSDLLCTCNIGLSTVIIDQRLTGKPQFPLRERREDWLLWLSLTENGDQFAGLDEVLVCYDLDSRPSVKVKRAFDTWVVYRHELKLNLVTSVFYFMQYAWNGLKKTY